MKPEAAEHLDRAGEYLIKARNQLDVLHYMTRPAVPPILRRYTPRRPSYSNAPAGSPARTEASTASSTS